MNRIFIGYDPRQAVSYSTLAYSIAANAKEPVSITPLVLETLPMKRQGLTPFTWSRFLVPYLCGFKGWALFKDADMLCLGDVSEVFQIGRVDSSKAVYVMQEQPAFEWASMILFNCEHPANAILTPEHIDNPQVTNLHKIGWVERRDIGKLPLEWNVCVPYSYEGSHATGAGMRPPPASPKLVHFTQGVPQWWETEDQPYAQAWLNYRDAANGATHNWWELMGKSVHFSRRLAALAAEGKVKGSTSEEVMASYAERAGLVKAEAAE